MGGKQQACLSRFVLYLWERIQMMQQVSPVYVGKIPPGVDDDFMRRLLEVPCILRKSQCHRKLKLSVCACEMQNCGPVFQWKRMQDASSMRPKPFGYCTFQSEESIARAVRILNGLKVVDRELMV
jgi:hypothetical protein